jgi:hypothetical protein
VSGAVRKGWPVKAAREHASEFSDRVIAAVRNHLRGAEH